MAETDVHLNHAAAQQSIQNIRASQENVRKILGEVEAEQEAMLSQNWRGDAATSYGRISSTQHDEFQRITTTLAHVVDLGEKHINSIASHDNG